jgi:hypothetical protein
MSADTAELVTRYIQAVGEKRFELLPPLFHADVTFGGPGVKPLQGAEAYIAALQRLGTILLRNDIKHVLVQGDEAVVIYDFITDTPAGAVASVEWLSFEQGRIRAVELTFDHGRWPEVLQALQAKLAAQN